MSLFSVTKVEMVQDGEFVRHVTVFGNKNGNGPFLVVNARLMRAHDENGVFALAKDASSKRDRTPLAGAVGLGEPNLGFVANSPLGRCCFGVRSSSSITR